MNPLDYYFMWAGNALFWLAHAQSRCDDYAGYIRDMEAYQQCIEYAESYL